MNESDLPTSAVLNLAADSIEKRGWTQGIDGWPTNDTSPVCLEGGIMAALGLRGTMRGELSALAECPAYRAVAEHVGNPYRLYDFNDAPSRTAAEVIEVLRACAVIEASREQSAAEATYAENLAATS